MLRMLHLLVINHSNNHIAIFFKPQVNYNQRVFNDVIVHGYFLPHACSFKQLFFVLISAKTFLDKLFLDLRASQFCEMFHNKI